MQPTPLIREEKPSEGRTQPPGRVTDSPVLQRGFLNIKNSIVVLAPLI